jgi:hypothetical protein
MGTGIEAYAAGIGIPASAFRNPVSSNEMI